jgi:hypothetical protein
VTRTTSPLAPHTSSQSSDDDDIHCHPTHTSSRHILAQVSAHKERDAQQMHQLLKLTLAKLDEQSQVPQTPSAAPQNASSARAPLWMPVLRADADATTAHTELALHKTQLEQARHEVSHAQEYLDGLEARRHDADHDAARAWSVARKLQEERAHPRIPSAHSPRTNAIVS